MLDWKKHTLSTLSELNLRASKSMGQNFLVRNSIITKIIKKANIEENHKIIEIGGGVGILTRSLIKTGAKITVIEKEKKLAKYLQNTFPEVHVIEGDALKIDFPGHDKVIANLPFSISTPILAKIFHSNSPHAILMLQKEVADRCVAKPGDRNYSRLSVLCQLHSIPKKLFDINPDAFFPKPKVTSSVVEFFIKPIKLSNSHEEVELLTRNLFTLRRRTLRSVLRGFLKRKFPTNSIWDEAPNKSKRVFELNAIEIDELLTYLKIVNAWPIAV